MEWELRPCNDGTRSKCNGMDPSMGGGIDPMTGMPLPAEPDPSENLEKEKIKKDL